MSDYDWEGDHTLQIPYHQVIAYSLHIRGFTRHPSSKVKAKGTFQGVIEKLEYLKDLGINQIHCMPVYEFEECQIYRNYWGYGAGSYFAPKMRIFCRWRRRQRTERYGEGMSSVRNRGRSGDAILHGCR